MKPIIVGYYTIDTPYESEAESLKVSIEPFEYEMDIRGIPNFGNWQKATQYKPKLLKSIFNDYPDQSLLYIDVDAIMVEAPILCDDLDCTIAAVHFANTTELLSGTLYFGPNNEDRMKLINRWIAINELYPEKLPDGREAWDQRTLQMAINETKANFIELPQGYTWISELTVKWYKKMNKPCPNPVILHTRGALRLKRKINRGSK